MRFRRNFFIFASLIFLALLCLGSQTARAEKAADFKLPSIDGGEVSLSDSEGKVRIVDFWATWCPPCRKGIPEFIFLYNEYKERGVEIIGVSLDQGETKDVKYFAEKMKMNYPVVMGNIDVVKAYGGVRAIPTAFVIDQKGNIVKKYMGYQPKVVFEEDIKSLLE